jgi:hypothetical protein
VRWLGRASGAAFGYALWAAFRRRPVRAAAAGALSMALKFALVGWTARLYDRTRGEHPDADLGLGDPSADAGPGPGDPSAGTGRDPED